MNLSDRNKNYQTEIKKLTSFSGVSFLLLFQNQYAAVEDTG